MVRTCTWPTCHNSLQPLVGRNVELATIERLMLDAGARLITLTGPGGVGKSRLALAAAEGLTEAFAHRVAFVEFFKGRPLTDESALRELLYLVLSTPEYQLS